MFDAIIRKNLRDFSLDTNIHAGPGEVVVLMGENGTGNPRLSILFPVCYLQTQDPFV